MGQIAELITAVLDGKQSPEALGPCWRADLAMPIYERACRILAERKEHRADELAKHPEFISDLLKKEMIRLSRERKK